MGAPTWPPTPEDAEKATLEEYGDMARAVIAGAEDDEAAEHALLSAFLFEPRRQLVAGEDNGCTLDEQHRRLHAWLRMVASEEGVDPGFQLAYSDPPSTDGEHVFLPRAVPAPAQPAADALLYRCMGLVQLGFAAFGFLENRTFLAEIHRDWVLRSAWHLLATRWIVRRWSHRWPGIAKDFRGLAFLDKASVMRVNVMVVPRKGMPRAFLPLYSGLVDHLEPGRSDTTEPGPAQAAVDAVDALDPASAAAANLVVIGQAQRLRQHFRSQRLGPPPLPYFAGIVRPEWLLYDLREEVAATNEWKKGQLPLRQLLKAMAKKSKPSGLRSLMRASSDGPPPVAALDEVTTQLEDRPELDDKTRSYDEWNDEKGLYRIGFTRVTEVPAPGGPLESYHRIVAANQAQIKEIRRKFEALRLEERWLHAQQDGTELDLNRAVAAMADIQAGFSPKVDWYKRFQRQRQSVAILTMVDLSGSTQGHLIHLEQEAIVLFAEGLRVLRFPHAFYGFSNQGPGDCTFSVLKGWEEQYDDSALKRLANLRPGGATRLGAFIRHATWSLDQQPVARRILMILSDGKPEDRGEYRGRYGIRDTAMAVHEARRAGVHVHCISMDRKARQDLTDADAVAAGDSGAGYLDQIFGRGRYLALDDVDELPGRLPEVFRGLVK